jgi:RNA polymerase sigma-70 factor (ECF subfamily)
MWFLSLYISDNSEGISPEEFRNIFLDMYPVLCVYAFWSENEKLKNKELIKPYLFKSVKHKALNYKKREQRKTPLDIFFDDHNSEFSIAETDNPDSFLAMNSLMDDLDAAINELPEQRQKIFRMSRFEQMKHKEIAKALGISPKTVETQIFRALRFLRQRLKHYF